MENDDYMRRVMPFLKSEYFTGSEKVIFDHIKKYTDTYNNMPTIEALMIEMSDDNTIVEDTFEDIDKSISNIKETAKSIDLPWLITTTEKFCKDRALEIALQESIMIFEGKSKKHGKGAIPDILSKALAIGFDTTVGHDYFENSDERYEYYHRKEEKIATGIEFLDKVTKGGFSKKTLNLFIAGTNAGKSLMMVNIAANMLKAGNNVLYITGEMAEEEIAKRVDANMLDIEIKDLPIIAESMFTKRIENLKNKTRGKLIIKEYPTSSASINHFRALLNELLLKKHFVPDVIFVDYLNIFISTRFKDGNVSNTNTYYKAISEELRGLGVEMNIPIVSASQLNRSGFQDSNPGMESTSEAFGINFVADFVAAMVYSEELAQQNRLLIKQLKSRYDNKTLYPMFFVGVDMKKMRYFDLTDPLDGIHNIGAAVQPPPIGKHGGLQNKSSLPLPSTQTNTGTAQVTFNS
jgi:archaellum biogenesis ATPase FlaH